jgi:chromosomal replication initiator protein
MPEILASTSAWPRVKSELQQLFPAELYQMWFEPLRCVEETDEKLVLGAPNDFAAIWIQDNYQDLIAQKYSEAVARPVRVTIAAAPNPAAEFNLRASIEPTPAPRTSAARSRVRVNLDQRANQSGILNVRNKFETFIVGSNNHLAHAACIAVAQAPAQAYNPLFLYGDTGLGKTHLMQAVGHHLLMQNPNAKVAYISSEKFTNEYITAIQDATLPRFRQRYRSVDILLIDDIHFLSGKERIQEEFFHTFNELFESQKQIILSSDRPVSEIARLEARLISRFQWGLVADIQSPDLETRTAILRSKTKALKCEIPDPVINFIAERITRNIRRLEGALIKVTSYAALTREPITLQSAAVLLKDVLQEEAQHQITIEMIQKRVVEHYGLRPSDMTSRRRPANIAFPRQIAMYLCRALTKAALQDIGENFGGRDHGTVMYACRTVENMMEQNENVRGVVEYLKNQITQRN